MRHKKIDLNIKSLFGPVQNSFCDTKTNTLRTEKKEAPSNIKSKLHFDYSCLGHIHLYSFLIGIFAFPSCLISITTTNKHKQ